MVTTVQQILAPETISHAISRMDLPGTTLQSLFGWGFAGSNRLRVTGRQFAYEIFDHTWKIASARLPGQASQRQAPQSIGTVRGTFPRSAESISLLDEELLNRRFGGASLFDLNQQGESYLTRQEAYLAQRFANLIEFQTAAMLRGSYSYVEDGAELRHGFEGGSATVDFRIPAGNRGQLDMLGTGNLLNADWQDRTTDIPSQLHSINAAFVRLTGMGLSHVVLSSEAWQWVSNNDYVQAQGGTANVVFQTMERAGSGEFTVILRALPWVVFHVVDYGLEVWNGSSEVYAKLVEPDHAAFFPEPTARWVQYLEGSEIVTEGPGGTREERFGFYPFAYARHDPSGWELSAVMNGIPALYVPAAIAYGQISGGTYA